MDWKELYCAVVGHDFTTRSETTDNETGRTIQVTKTCDRCEMSKIDNSGGYALYKERFGDPQAIQRDEPEVK